MRHTVLLSLLVLLMMSCNRATDQAAVEAEPITIEVRLVTLAELKLDTDVVGKLKFRGGINLTSPDSRFGGLSGVQVSEDGRNFSAVSDRGHLFLGELTYDANGNLVGVADTRIKPLLSPEGKKLTDEDWRNAESMAQVPERGLAIAFERANRVLLYPQGGGPPTRLQMPKELDSAPASGGIKSLAVLPDGQLLALTANVRTSDGVVGWVGRDNAWSRIVYSIEKELSPTGASAMPGGDILVLERRLPLVAARLRRLEAATVQPEAVLKAQELALLADSLQFFNMQGVDVRQDKEGAILIYLVADNNYTGPQPNAVLMFELVD